MVLMFSSPLANARLQLGEDQTNVQPEMSDALSIVRK